MEFWGIEIKPGEIVKCEPGDDKYLHLSQASLGEVKKAKGNESIPIHLKFDNQKLVIGTLSADKCPHITYDLVFEKEFELSHGWKNGSVFFVGYKTEIPDDGPDDFSGMPKSNNELEKRIADILKARSLAAKSSVKEENKEEEDDDSGEDEDESDEDDGEDMLDGEDDSGDEDGDDNESSEEEDDDSPEAEIGKKRAAESALKTIASGKKAKLIVPGSDGKKGGHTATPHPFKQAGRTPTTNDKLKQLTPESAGLVSCKSCCKAFKNDNALKAHTKARHPRK